jgi:CBS domain containing-hemolysin-like protein
MLVQSSTIGSVIYFGVPLLIAASSYVFFIVASLSIVRSSVARLEELVELEALGAASAQRIVERSDSYLLCTQMGRLCSSVGAGFCLAFFTGHIARLFSDDTVSDYSNYGIAVASLVAIVFMASTLVTVQIAKAVSLQFPEKALCLVALPLSMSCALVAPILLFIHTMVAKVLARFDVRPTTERDIAVTADDLSEIVKFSTEAGSLEQNEQRLIEGVVEFSERIVREVMTPRKDIVWAKESASTEDIIGLFSREAVSRVLVCGSDLDDVKGMVLAKDLLQFIAKSGDTHAWRLLVRPTYIVPNTKPVDDLLFELRSKGIHLAVVLDEHGGVVGIVTLEDLVEQIVGEIFDETDVGSDREPIMKEAEGRWVIDGSAPVDELPESFGIDASDGRFDTIAGFILDGVGRLPEQGEVFELSGLECTILEVRRHHIARVAVRVIPRPVDGEGDDEGLIAVNGVNVSQRKT